MKKDEFSVKASLELGSKHEANKTNLLTVHWVRSSQATSGRPTRVIFDISIRPVKRICGISTVFTRA